MASQLTGLDRKIRTAHIIVLGLILLIVAAYAVWFGIINSQKLSNQPGSWAQFGAFAGGILSPLVAYAAFYWLTKAVRLQKEELSFTRQVLESTSESQSRHAAHALTSVRVTALSALINSIMGEVQIQRLQLQLIVDQMESDPNRARMIDGRVLRGRELQDYLNKINSRIERRMSERYKYEEELKGLLYQDQPAHGFNTGPVEPAPVKPSAG